MKDTALDSIKEGFYKKIGELYEMEVEKNGGKRPEKFKTIEDMMHIVFDKVIEAKSDLLNQKLSGLYGFKIEDLIQGYYEKTAEK